MGLCASSDAASKFDTELESQLREAERASSQEHKVLLLGAGESGKSTVMKQMRINFGAEYTEKDFRERISAIRGNAASGMQAMLEYCKAKEYELGSASQEALAEFEAAEKDLARPDGLTAEVAAAMKTLWADPAMKKAFEERANYQLMDTTDYFLDRIDTIAREDYMPNKNDFVRSRVRTTGMHEQKIDFRGVVMTVCDVGGQRAERRKWFRFFADVDIVLFIAASSEYDQVLFEDSTMNRIVEAAELFDSIVRSGKYFDSSGITLFLNKDDLFQQKIEKVGIGQVKNPMYQHLTEKGEEPIDADGELIPEFQFDDYDGRPNDYDDAFEYLQNQFITPEIIEHREHTQVQLPIATYAVTALDTRNVKRVFEAVASKLLNDTLQDNDLV